ncbi:unnamed protein product [Sphacelaria rigidula]
MLEDLELLANNTHSISVQLFTFNGHERTAYGHVLVDFEFSGGGEVTVEDSVTSYVLTATFDSDRDRARRITAAIFTVVALGTMFGDFREFRRNRRVKARLRKRLCCCGCTFHVLIIFNMIFWMGWATIGYIPIDTELQLNVPDQRSEPLDQLVRGILLQHELALFAGVYKQLFLATTLVGLYRLLFQKLTFHRRMSIVTDTLSGAGTNLGHLLFVFLLVLAVFVEVTWLLVGKGSAHFTRLGDALESMIRVSLGEGESFYPEILEVQPELGVVLVVFYQVLGVVLLLNVVVAILLEAYRGVVVGMRDEDTIFQALTAFVGMTLLSWQTRVRWAGRYLRWRVGRRRVLSERPSLKVALQGPTGVIGVDGFPVVMVRRPDPFKAALVERQLSYNCPRYITVTEMMALIEATPVPAFVAERIVRRIVHHWVFHSDEKITSRGYLSDSRSGAGGNGGDSCDSLPMLRRRNI